MHTELWSGNLREKTLEDLGIEGILTSKLIFKKWDRVGWLGLD